MFHQAYRPNCTGAQWSDRLDVTDEFIEGAPIW